MPDFTRVVEFLRDIRQGPLQSVNDEITQLAADYAVLCTQANERLRQCTAFLQQGLRTEAIHLAEESPNLLDFVAALDLPDQQAWAEFCQNNGLAVPPPLQLERAGQLNEAYAQDQPLEHLMAHHRLLALSRAPIRERLDTLRKIADVDTAGSGAWEKDIRIFEKARLKELPSAFHRAVKKKDNDGITALMDEVGRQNWYEAVPADLVTAVTDAFSRVQKAGVEAQLQKLVEPLRDAFAARSLQECQALVQRWKNIMASGGVSQVSTELTDEIRPVVAFVNEQTKRDDYLKRFRDSCKIFTKMLDEDAPDAQLEAGYAKLRDFKEDIPDDIVRRYAAKKTGRRETVERSHKTRLVIIASLAVAVIVVVLVVIFLLQQSGASRDFASHINSNLAQHSLSGLMAAERYVQDRQKSDPAILKETIVASAVSKMEEQRRAYDHDVGVLAEQLKASDEALAAAKPVMANRGASAAEVAGAAGGAQKCFNDLSAAAAELAWVDGDSKVPATINSLKGVLDALKDRANAAAISEREALAIELQAVPENPSTPEAAADAQAKIGVLRDRLAVIRNMPLLSAETIASLDALTQEIRRRSTGAAGASTIAGELQNIRTHADSAANLQVALESFVAKYPSDARTAEFKVALARMPAAKSLDAWQQLADPFAKTPPGNVANAQKRVDAITAFLTASPTMPLTAAANAYVDYLKHAIDAQAADKSAWQVAFTDIVAHPLLAEMEYMQASDGTRFYTLGPINRKAHILNDQTSVSFDALSFSNPQKPTATVTVTINPPNTVPEKPALTPHAKAVAEIAENLKSISDSNWDTYGIDLVDRLAHNDQCDPVVKGLLMQAALKGEKEVTTWGGSSPIESDYASALTRWENQKLGDMIGKDPNKTSDATRASLKGIIDSLPSAAAEKQKLADAKAALLKALTIDATGTGVLLKDDAGAWRISLNVTPQEGDTLMAIQGADPAAPGTLQSIGTITGGKATLNSAALQNLPQGSLFYLIHTSR